MTRIYAGYAHSVFLKSDGSLWSMGGGSGLWTNNAIASTNCPQRITISDVTAIAAGDGYNLLLKNDRSLWAAGADNFGQLGDGTFSYTNRPEQILAPYNQISGRLLGDTNMQLSFVGIANTNYALDRASSLSPANWMPLATNPASSFGPLVFSNALDPTTNSFWRIRSLP